MKDDDAQVRAAGFIAALGQELRRLRRERDLSQVEVAERAGVSQATIKRIERDGPKGVEDAWRIADVLGVPFAAVAARAAAIARGESVDPWYPPPQ